MLRFIGSRMWKSVAFSIKFRLGLTNKAFAYLDPVYMKRDDSRIGLKTPVKSIWAHVYMENPICLAPQMSASISRIKSFSSQTVFTWIRLESFKPILSWISSQSSQLCGLTLAVRFDQFFQSSSCKYNMGGLTWTPNPLFYHSTFLSLNISITNPFIIWTECTNSCLQ